MCKKIILLTSKKLYRQTQEIANALVKEAEYSAHVDEENQKLIEENQELEDKILKLYDELKELHESYMQELESNRSLEYINDILEGKLEYYAQHYGDIFEDEL